MCNPLVVYIVHVTMAVIGVLVGIAAACALGIIYDNPHAAGWAGGSGIFALVLLVVIVLVYKKKLSNWLLTLFALVGATGILVGATTFFVYLILGIFDKDGK